MSNYPQSADVFVNKTGADSIASSDPNNAYDGIEAVQGLIGALGEPQTWSTTLMTLLRSYKSGMGITAVGGAPVVGLGEICLENTSANRYAFRRNSADVTLSAANLDVGSMAVNTYYIYALGNGAATTAPMMFSTDALAPSGIGTAPFKQLGWFLNAAAGALAVTYTVSIPAEVEFGAWDATRSQATVYLAATDGFVQVRSAGGVAANGLTDSFTPPTTTRATADLGGSSFCMPVKKGDYWEVTGVGCQLWWIPLNV